MLLLKRKTFFTLRKKMVILRVPSFLRVQSITGNGELWDVECPLSALVHAPCLNSQSSCCWHLCHLCRPPYPDLLSAPTPSSWVPARPPFSLSLWARLPPRQSAGALDAASSLLELVPMEAGPERHSWKFYKRSGRKAGRQTERFVRAASLSLFTCALVLYLYPCPSLSQSRASRTGSFFPSREFTEQKWEKMRHEDSTLRNKWTNNKRTKGGRWRHTLCCPWQCLKGEEDRTIATLSLSFCHHLCAVRKGTAHFLAGWRWIIALVWLRRAFSTAEI